MARADQPQQQYFPILKWKAGEQQAVHQLSYGLRDKILPIVEIQNRLFDWTEEKFFKSWKEHIDFSAKTTAKYWGTSHEVAIDQNITEDDQIEGGGDAWTALFKKLWQAGVKAVPVVSSLASESEINVLANLGNQYACTLEDNRFLLRYKIDNPEDSSVVSIFKWFQSTLKTLATRHANVDAVVDFGHIGGNYQPHPVEAANILEALRLQGPWRSVVFAAGAFPENLGGLLPGIHILPRNEWKLYKEAVLLMNSTEISYGDYAVNYTEPFTGDFRAMRPSINLRYTHEDEWLVFKAPSSKEHFNKKYQELCQFLVNEQYFMGKNFSFGDSHIYDVAQGNAVGGNPSTWRRDATNHHIHMVLSQLENLSH